MGYLLACGRKSQGRRVPEHSRPSNDNDNKILVPIISEIEHKLFFLILSGVYNSNTNIIILQNDYFNRV